MLHNESINYALQWNCPFLLNRSHQIINGFFSPPFSFLDGVHMLMKPENIGRRLDEAIFAKRDDVLLTESLDIKCSSGDKML